MGQVTIAALPASAFVIPTVQGSLGTASCNMVNACDLTANALSGVQLGSGYTQADNTLTDNVIQDCAVNGAASCGAISTFNGIVTYGTAKFLRI